MPSIVCDDFFNSYANCVFGDSKRATTGQQLELNNAKRRNKTTKLTKQVKVCCQISEVDESRPGNKLIRRKLTKLKEEEEEEEEDDYDEEDNDGERDKQEDEDEAEDEEEEEDELEDDDSRGKLKRKLHSNSGFNQANSISCKITSNPNKRENEDFGIFLRSQISTSSKAGKARKQIVNVYQRNLPPPKMKSNKSTNRSQRHLSDRPPTNRGGKNSNKMRCFELFCVHQASLLVHRDQVLIEAQRLAERLAMLMSGEQT